jgi:hypothetical protein
MNRLLTIFFVVLAINSRAGLVVDGVHIDAELAEEARLRIAGDLLNSADAFVFPVFHLVLGGSYTDFEIKASTNNFASVAYIYLSTGHTGISVEDPAPLIYFTDDESTDVRVWRKALPFDSLGNQIASSEYSKIRAVVFCPSRDGVGYSQWMRSGNTNLVWSWVRADGVSFEMNATGSRSSWTPIRPVSWEKSPVVP